MTDDELDAIEARCNKATPQDWYAVTDIGGESWVAFGASEDIVADNCALDDAVFIAAARADVPALIAEVRRLREELLTAIERTQRSVHDYYYDKIRNMTIEIEQLHDQIGRDAISYAQCDSDRRNFAARCAWMREELMDRGVTRKELDNHE